MTTVTANEVRRITEENGYEVERESVHEEYANSAAQRLRFTFWLKHRATGIEINCWLRHNMEGHNDAPNNTHRLLISVGDAFHKCFDFHGKANGPSEETLKNYFKKLSAVLDGFIDLQ